jgi:hypothetical protein
MKIAKARIEQSSGMFNLPKVHVTLEGETEEKFLFEYLPKEISFTADEFVGITEEQAHGLRFSKDVAYIKSR